MRVIRFFRITPCSVRTSALSYSIFPHISLVPRLIYASYSVIPHNSVQRRYFGFELLGFSAHLPLPRPLLRELLGFSAHLPPSRASFPRVIRFFRITPDNSVQRRYFVFELLGFSAHLPPSRASFPRVIRFFRITPCSVRTLALSYSDFPHISSVPRLIYASYSVFPHNIERCRYFGSELLGS